MALLGSQRAPKFASDDTHLLSPDVPRAEIESQSRRPAYDDGNRTGKSPGSTWNCTWRYNLPAQLDGRNHAARPRNDRATPDPVIARYARSKRHITDSNISVCRKAYFYVQKNPKFDLRRTPSKVGPLTEVFRPLPSVVRSLHPTHPVAA